MVLFGLRRCFSWLGGLTGRVEGWDGMGYFSCCSWNSPHRQPRNLWLDALAELEVCSWEGQLGEAITTG